MTVLAPLSAAGLVTIMVLALAFHVFRGELEVLPINIALGALAAFVAWGRQRRVPIRRVRVARPGRGATGGLALLVIGGCTAGLGLAELTLRIVGSGPALPWNPAIERDVHPDPRYVPGVSGPARFEVSAEGYRSGPVPTGPAIRILAIGGSTTECAVLDTGETWPALVESALRARLGQRVWVGNAGRSGISSRHHVVQAEVLLDQLPRVDALVLLVGGNNLLRALKRPQEEGDWYTAPRERVRVHYESFDIPSRPRVGRFWERTELVRLLRRTRQTIAERRNLAGLREAVDGRPSEVGRQRRRDAAMIATLPPLDDALAAYRRDLKRIIGSAERHGTRVLFATQPTLWHADLSPALDSLLLLGEGSAGAYYTAGALAEGMARFNAELLALCAERGLACLDLAGMLPQDTTVYYDDMHFNESGARAVAAAMTAFLAQQGIEFALPLPGADNVAPLAARAPHAAVAAALRRTEISTMSSDQTSKCDLTQPDPVPEYEFDQSIPDDFDL